MKCLFLIILIVLLLPIGSCINDDPQYIEESTVTYVEKYLISYNEYHCREAIIDKATRPAMFPIEYENDIVKGTKVKYYCNKIYSYKSSQNKWVEIKW